MSIQHPASGLQHPILIVGGGLAGTAVAWRMWQRHEKFVVVDPGRPDTCSKIAAGLVTPITGLRLTVSPGFAEHLSAAREFYREIGKELGEAFYHEVPHVRLFKDARELKHWRARSTAPGFQEWLDPDAPNPLVDERVFRAELGGIQQRGSGWLDTAGYLAASQQHFEKRGCWRQGVVDEEALELGEEGVRWNGDTYRLVVLCRGAEGRTQARFFPWLPWQCARGVIATVKAQVPEERIVARNCWLLPRNGSWRAGSTYDWDLDAPIEPSIEMLREKLAGLLRVPFEMTDIQMGVRPILRERAAAVGRHPVHPKVAMLNGLGSKGALQAPYLARMLVDHLTDGAAIDEKVDVAANDLR
jgi:glycine/D-amino acid oxidase-like deaminating enzyme